MYTLMTIPVDLQTPLANPSDQMFITGLPSAPTLGVVSNMTQAIVQSMCSLKMLVCYTYLTT